MKRLSPVLFLLITAFLTDARAQSPDKILKQATRAQGGEKTLRAVRSWYAVGSIVRNSDGQSGRYEASTMAPNLYRTGFDIRGLETGFGFNGRSAWYRDSRDGLRTLTGQASRDFQTEAQYRNSRWLDYRKEKSRISSAGRVEVNGKPANVVVLTTAKNVNIRMYFDASTGLLVRDELPSGETTLVFDYSDFRPVDGIQEPHKIVLKTARESWLIVLEKIQHNLEQTREAFSFPKISSDPLPDIQTLLQAVKSNEDKIDELLEKYTYTQKQTDREFDSSGQLREKKSETHELTFYKGNRIRRLIEKDGRPLNAKDQEAEDKRLERQILNIEKKADEKERKAQKAAEHNTGGPPAEEERRLSISDVLRASRFVNPRRERFRGRDVIVFDFEPLPGYKPQKDYEKFFGKAAGAMWIDAGDSQVARVEVRLIESFKMGGGLLASFKEGATFVMEQDRINNEIWLPTRAEINLSVKVLLVKGFSANAVIEYGNYKRFNVESEKEKLKAPDPKPMQ